MRILYGANSQGQGHLSKAAVLIPLLEQRGHEVRLVTSGPQPTGDYTFRWHRHLTGLPYIVEQGRTDYGKTFRSWLRNFPAFMTSLNRVRKLVQTFQPELILSDFEPITASPLIGPHCEVIAISRQVTLFDRAVPLPESQVLEKKLTRTAIRLFTCGADRLYGYHFEPASFRCVPPVLRPEILQARPEQGDHILVYCHFEDAAALMAWAASRRQPVRAYGFSQMPRGRHGWVEFRPASRTGMLHDLRTAKAVITNAGLTTPVEAFLLGKPTLVVPIASQWEQVVNAFHQSEARIAEACDTWDFDRIFDVPPPTLNHPLSGWLRTSPEVILDHLLDEDRATKRDQIRRQHRQAA
ncbi:hypothetical protein GC163_17430 [bacterium]|nr:hypothetical protein [bacterium]